MNRIKHKKIVLFALSVFLLFSCNSGEEKKIIRTQSPSPEIPPTSSAPYVSSPDSAPNISPVSPLSNIPSSGSPAHISPQNPSPNVSPPAYSGNISPLSPPPSYSGNSSPQNPPPYDSPSGSPVHNSPQNPLPNISPPEKPLSAKSFSAELLPPPLPLTEEQKEELGIVGVIQSNTAGSHFCTETYVPRNTTAELTIRWSVNAQGKMSPIYVLENPTNNTELAKCFTAFLSQLEYPKSLEGDTTTLIQTFVFLWK